MKEITFDFLKSNIECLFYTDEDENILKVCVNGICGEGSSGNLDINKIFLLSNSHFILIEPECIIFDLTNFQYTWGNTLLKILNFTNEVGRNEYERNIPIFFLISELNQNNIASLLNLEVKELPNNFLKDYQEAINIYRNNQCD